MERGFDKLNNPEGVAIICFAGFLVVCIIVAGAIFSRAVERENRAKREAAKSTLAEPKSPF